MTSYTVASSDLGKHAFTLTASTVDTVTLTGYTRVVEIVSDGAAAVYYTTDGTTPTVAGANTYPIPAVSATDTRRLGSVNGDGVLKFISTGTPTLWVVKSE